MLGIFAVGCASARRDDTKQSDTNAQASATPISPVPARVVRHQRWLISIARPILLAGASQGNSRRRAALAQQRGDLGLAAELRPAQDGRLILVVLDAGIRSGVQQDPGELERTALGGDVER